MEVQLLFPGTLNGSDGEEKPGYHQQRHQRHQYREQEAILVFYTSLITEISGQHLLRILQ
jgi:hypothetical protein